MATKATITATCGVSSIAATIYVVEVVLLDVSGASAINEDEYATPIAVSGDVIITAVTIPDISGLVSALPNDFITWIGGADGGDQLHRKVTKTVAIQTNVTATCGTSSAFASVFVVEISALDVTGAGTIGEDEYATPIAASGDVLITAITTPDISSFVSSLPSGFIIWNGGADGDDQLHRKVTKTVAAKIDITAFCGTSSASVAIYIIRLDSKTTEHAPDRTFTDDRTTIGVCETTTITIFPTLSADWTVAGLGAATPTGSTSNFEAADIAHTSIVSASINGVPIGSITYTVIAPNGSILSAPIPKVYTPLLAGSGFDATVTIQPTNVCFSGIEVQEQTAIATANGYYDKVLKWNGLRHPLGTWNQVDNLNSGIADSVGTVPPGSPGPFSVGTFIWNIPQNYRRAGSGANYNFTTLEHRQTMLGSSGAEITTKGGATNARVP